MLKSASTPKGRAEVKVFERQDFSKPKPNFDWDALDQAFSPTIPEAAITIRDLMEHFHVKTSRAQQLAAEGVRKGLLKRIAKGWYMRP